MSKKDFHISISDSPPGGSGTASRRRAVILFSRTPLHEARAKRIEGLDLAQRIKLFAALTRGAVRSAVESGLDLVVATDALIPVFRERAAHVVIQRGENFGERLLNAVRDTLALGYDEVALIGNDSPELDGEKIRTALTERPHGSLGLCRASDGGVTLLALDRELVESCPALFHQPRWETCFLFDDLAALARTEGIVVEERKGGDDLDSLTDLIRLVSSSETPDEFRRFALSLLPTRSVPLSSFSYIPPLRRTLRTCRQKAPPPFPAFAL